MSDGRKRTPWMSVKDQPPTMVGKYEWRAFSGNESLVLRWNGFNFCRQDGKPMNTWANDRWRGLAEKPE